ncbi:MAG: 30S ribosomal protein S7 [Candidatus Lloydbacteria bacterium RIFCSPHIGHO2_01_FULL_49_22]|uniref:Small ribosomal subunit protein uS7 n=1 Tax=Candidatus Lloydbacteria bacterium RIFCSPHIGHO2_01_FULL_49_22 TaxID=1798658 RepID=A0A1G2CY27_9BACT|nr:MAG: 30S ribosomal protein S7 [Candidatus Lloydbacteria bacterium RIFCSPHIGHO2_01_FULL_49_22]OGZ09356.1 MAG: 30S ribosomal protein S7 [Candidatus Lloydbacteria bacterium RIFCSPHIGHO2_02_FULL_50_18]
MRGPVKNRNIRKPDAKYHSVEVSTLINYVMWEGKKTIATTVVYDALELIKTQLKVEDPIEVYKEALRNAGPIMEIRSRRVGGANYQVPREVRPERRIFLALRWIIDAARSKKGAGMAKKLADEIISASKNEGEAIKKRENVHKMAEANKAFAHFAW